ncbi:BTAD domain-containing putative transcriptional regulator [Streptomyces sp. NPDC057565]|uniref:BTAD domain-containing putative transcriptional regulator n=1 Tax=Streptomyces sp. NPDC057565 TaxID=3346169 RepID=UPI00367D1ED1
MVTELTDLVAAHPVRERLVAALMRALVAVRELTAGAGPGPAPRPPAMQIACEANWVGGGLVGGHLVFGRRTMLSVGAGTTVYVVLLNACA